MTTIPRRSWAPFVGAALAALTAGSLVVFSLVAQRTSLDGFPDRPGAAPADTSDDGRPASITIAPIAGGSEEAAAETELAGDAELEGETALSLIEVAQVVPTTTVAVEPTTGPSASGASNRDALTPRGDTGDFDGRFRADGILLANRSGGGDSVDPKWDARHDGKHAHKSHDVKSKKNDKRTKDEKHKKNGKHKSSKNFKAKRNSAHGRRSGQRHSSSSSSAGGSQGKGQSSPAPRPQSSPDRSAKPSGGGSPPAHSNAGGNGKSRGRGHKKH